MLARRRLPPRIRGRLFASWVVHPSAVAGHLDAPAAFRPWSLRQISSTVQRDRSCRLFTAAVAASPPRHTAECGSTLLGIARPDGGVRRVSGTSRRAAKVKVAHGARRETPAIPSFIEIRELATLLRVKPRALFKSLGGYQEKKKHRIVLSGVPYAFPNLGSVIVPFEDTRAVAKVLDKEIRFLDVDKRPQRAALAAPSGSQAASVWEEGRHDGQGRRPVVVLLGHFNHGKTTILDALLGPSSGIAEREAGGITQEIRARTVALEAGLAGEGHRQDGGGEAAATNPFPSPPAAEINGQAQAGDETTVETAQATVTALRASLASKPTAPTVATFLDTPGQEIFYRMRTNGARVADAVVLVVSAVDGICLQTSESIGCAEELGLPAVVVLNKIDLLPEEEAAQRVKELSAEVREFVAIRDAKVIPLSAHTGHGLDSLRTTLAGALSQPSTGTPDAPGLEAPEFEGGGAGAVLFGSGAEVPAAVGRRAGEDGEEGDVEVVMAEAPEGAATATVLDYTSSAKTGKVLLVLVDRGILRPGDSFVSGMLWGFVRSIYDEEGRKLLDQAGPGVAAKVVVVARTRVSNAPLGEPFRVLTNEAAEKVAVVRAMARTIDDFVDHYRLERDFPHLLDMDIGDEKLDESSDEGEEGHEDDEHLSQQPEQSVQGSPGRPDSSGNIGGVGGVGGASSAAARGTEAAGEVERPRRPRQHGAGGGEEEEELAPEDMPVTIVIKADSANTLASVLDAVGDWGDVENPEERPGEQSVDEEHLPEEPSAEGRAKNNTAAQNGAGGFAAAAGNETGGGPQQKAQHPRPDWGEKDLQHKQRRRLVVSVARSGVGAVTTSDVRLARDCECPVFAHNVRADAAAARELKRVGGAVVNALPEGAVAGSGDEEVAVVGVGGQDGFIGRAGEGRECVVVSETVGELLGEIERFVLRVR